MKLAAVLSLFSLSLSAQTAEEIMRRVAENQTRAENARAAYVYQQNLLVRLLRSGGKLAREEIRDYVVTPAPGGTRRKMVHFTGNYGAHGKIYPFTTPGFEYKGMDIDANLVENIADRFGDNKKSKDGINRGMFPLTAEEQKRYQFKLAGRDRYREWEVYRVTFEPAKNREEDDPADWVGEALVEIHEFQPVLVTTHFAHKIPMAVKVMAGTNFQNLGFKVTYKKFGDVWFPVTYGGELKLRAAFLYARTIAFSIVNSDFRKASVETSVTFADAAQP